jgi:choline dehydrogenase-like flavoprotein
MSVREEYGFVVLGSGEPGKLLAWTLATQGKRLAVIERRYVGDRAPTLHPFRANPGLTGSSQSLTASLFTV